MIAPICSSSAVAHAPAEERLTDEPQREPHHLLLHVHGPLLCVAIEVAHQFLEHVLLHRQQLGEVVGLEALGQQFALPQPRLAVDVDEPCPLELHHALDLDEGLLIVVPVAAQHVFDDDRIGSHHRGLDAAEVDGERRPETRPVPLEHRDADCGPCRASRELRGHEARAARW